MICWDTNRCYPLDTMTFNWFECWEITKNKNWIFTPLSKWYSKSVWTSMLYECLMYQRALWHLNTLKLDVLYSRPSRLSSFSIVVVNVVSMLKMWLKMRQRPKSILSKNAFLLPALAILWLNATCRPTYRLGAVTPNYASCSILAVWLQSVKRSCLQCAFCATKLAVYDRDMIL